MDGINRLLSPSQGFVSKGVIVGWVKKESVTVTQVVGERGRPGI